MNGEIAGEFYLDSEIPDYIAPGEEINVSFAFAPKKLGQRTSTFTINSECANPISIQLIGNGTCKGESVDLVEVGKKTVGIRSRIVVPDIFTNPTSQVIRITPVIENDPSSEYEIFALDQNGVEQPTINVPAFSSSTFVIYFTPSDVGIRTARINYGVTSACENTFSDLQGEGISSAIVGTVPPITNRIRTVNQGTITLENLSDLNSRISNLQIVNDPNNYFRLVNVNNSYDIAGNESVDISYEFVPLTEGDFTANLQFQLASGATDASTELTGRGLFPELAYELICPQSATQSQTSNATLRITNNSNLTAVDVISVTSNSADYVFDNGTNVSNPITIPINDSRDVNVRFTPSLGGNIQHDFDILADAAIGYLVDDSFAADTTLPKLIGECTATPNENSEDMDFGFILVCDKPGRQSYNIVNNSSSPLIINSADVVILPNNGIFTVGMPATLNIPANDSAFIEILFTPKQNIPYNATINFRNNLNVDYTLNVSGEGVYIDLTSSKTKETFDPGIVDKLTFSADIPELASYANDNSPFNNSDWNIEELKINVKYNNKVVNFLDDKITDLTNGSLTWTLDRISFEEFNIVGNGSLPTEYDDELVSIDFFLYLSDDYKSDIKYQVSVENCYAGDVDSIEVELSEFCVREFRVFETTGVSSNIEPVRPNPISSNQIMNYSTAFDGPVKIEVRNSIGDLVQTPVDQYINSGYYQFELDVESLPNGMYFINYQTLFKTETVKFIVNK